MSERKAFDGIVCIGGEDWWYHNRGHFDFQIMRRLARHWPVLFVNSLGVRMPSLGEKGQFAHRIGRKLKSLARGVVHVENNFWVFSPASVPGEKGQKLTQWALAPQIRLAAARAGIRRPVLWMHCPAGAGLMGQLAEVATVMQRTDRFEAFPEGDPVLLGRQVDAIRRKADIVVYAAPHLMGEEKASARRQLLVTHGVELEAFVAAGDEMGSDPLPRTARSCRGAGCKGSDPYAACPADVAPSPRPRVGFIGGIDAHTFDPELFLATARRLPDVNFVMIGATSLPEHWCTLPNVRFLGRKPYDEIARYMAAMDVLIMPWNRSEWIKACNPIKLKEYLAVGRPVVTTDFEALAEWRDLVRVAGDADAFAGAIRAALDEPYDAAAARARVAGESWDAKAGLVADAILDLGLAFEPRRAGAWGQTHGSDPVEARG